MKVVIARTFVSLSVNFAKQSHEKNRVKFYNPSEPEAKKISLQKGDSDHRLHHRPRSRARGHGRKPDRLLLGKPERPPEHGVELALPGQALTAALSSGLE